MEPFGGFSANFLSVDPIVSKKREFRVETKAETNLYMELYSPISRAADKKLLYC